MTVAGKQTFTVLPLKSMLAFPFISVEMTDSQLLVKHFIPSKLNVLKINAKM